MIEIQIKQLKQKYNLWLTGFQEGLNTQTGKAGRWWGRVGARGTRNIWTQKLKHLQDSWPSSPLLSAWCLYSLSPLISSCNGKHSHHQCLNFASCKCCSQTDYLDLSLGPRKDSYWPSFDHVSFPEPINWGQRWWAHLLFPFSPHTVTLTGLWST